MGMPGRQFSGGYRYGFNGKENDNEVKGEGNQQDYGMRIYDTRLGRFLSVDPLVKSYPFYSPYHFAGNNPIENIDLDGAEPKSFTREYKPESVFILNTRQEVGSELSIYDTELNPITVQAIHDITTRQLYFVYKDASGQWFYLKNDDGNDQVMHLKPFRGGPNQIIANGKFVPYKTYDEIHADLMINLAEKTATAFFGISAGGALIAALPGTVSALSTFLTARASDPSSWASAASDYSAQRLSGKSNSEVNLTSVALNWLIPGGGTVKSELIAAATTAVLSSGAEYSSNEGFENSLFGNKSVNSFLVESFNDASGNFFGGKFGGKSANYLQRGAGDKVTNFGLGIFGNFVPDLIINGASNSASDNQKKLLEDLNK